MDITRFSTPIGSETIETIEPNKTIKVTKRFRARTISATATVSGGDTFNKDLGVKIALLKIHQRHFKKSLRDKYKQIDNMNHFIKEYEDIIKAMKSRVKEEGKYAFDLCTNIEYIEDELNWYNN